MKTADIAAHLNRLAPRILDGLSSTESKAVLEKATLRRLRANSIIAREGDRADAMFLLLEGRARHFTMTREGEKLVVDWIKPGHVIGVAALLKRRLKYVVSSEAVVDSFALVWKHDAILTVARLSPNLLENALEISGDYLARYRDLHIAVSYDTADKRVASVLEKLTREIGHKVNGGVELKISNEELANESSVTVFTVSRLLSEWKRKGLLVKGRGTIVLHSSEQLLKATRGIARPSARHDSDLNQAV
jgi:CRP-like cAMP-binding protein